jgi:hypothetical protein
MTNSDEIVAPSGKGLKLRPWMVAALVTLLYVGVVLARNQFNPLTLVSIAAQELDPYQGYDGQFSYTIALDPATAPAHLDAPAYRLQRILLPILARMLAFGQPVLVPWSLLIINVVALVVGTALLEQLLRAEQVTAWFALVYGLFPGILMPVRLSLNEPLAYGLVLAAIWLERRDRVLWSAVMLGLAALAKETSLLFTFGYLAWMALSGNWRGTLRLGLIALLPFVIWQAALYTWLGEMGVGSGGALSTPFEIIPYMGFIRIYTETGNLGLWLIFLLLLAPIAIVPSLWGLCESVRSILRRVWHPYVFLLLMNAAVIAITPFSTFREPLGILRFLPGLVISTLIFSAHFKNQRLLLYSLIWLSTLATVVISA